MRSGAIIAGVAIWFFDALPYLVNWLWLIAGALFGVLVLCLVVAFFMFGAQGEGTESEEIELRKFRERTKSKPRLVQNGKPKSE